MGILKILKAEKRNDCKSVQFKFFNIKKYGTTMKFL